MEWSDLVLADTIFQQIYELENWVKHSKTLMQDWDMKRKLKPGYRALFHGPPGTGKTLTASLLGKYTGKDVFRIDLSMVVSKFIGETEKNLSQLFNRAENKNWILFFDEADALFSKRTNVRDAHDKYANQEAAYLLQRIENFDGLVILATNFKNNIDEAFIRRFQSVIHFPSPGVAERLKLWKMSFPEKVKLNKDVDFAAISKKYEVTGSSILSVVQYCCLQAISNKSGVDNDMIIEAVKREYLKEGKIW
jgi:SpoVK/Ycf46/Vps4 family AAA+-type ATPase